MLHLGLSGLNSSGNTRYTLRSFTAGSHALHAVYNVDTNYF